MVYRFLTDRLPDVSIISYGAFKLGRNEKFKYPTGFDLPTDEACVELLNLVLDLGINLVDTAPAYGVSENRIGAALTARRAEYILSTKVGETFENGTSTYAFDAASVRRSLERSLRNLRTDVLDIVHIHSDGRDLEIIEQTDVVATLQQARDHGLLRAIGFSGKTVDGARRALDFADVLMIEYHPQDVSHADLLSAAADQQIGVIVKKPLAAGHLAPAAAIPFVTRTAGVSSLLIASLRPDHVRENIALAQAAAEDPDSMTSMGVHP